MLLALSAGAVLALLLHGACHSAVAAPSVQYAVVRWFPAWLWRVIFLERIPEPFRGATPLHVACRHGDSPLVKKLLEGGEDPDETDGFQTTPLRCAVRAGSLDCARALFAFGANPNVATEDGETPLFAATWMNDAACARALLDAGADPNAANAYGVAPLRIACSSGYRACIDALLGHGASLQGTLGDRWTEVHALCALGNPSALDRLLKRRTDDVDLEDMHSRTPLRIAAERNHTACAEVLLHYGADVNRGSVVSPLWAACERGHAACTRVLLRHLARVDAADAHGRTPLYMACSNNYVECVHLLIGPCEKRRPLYVACQRSSYACVRALLRHNTRERTLDLVECDVATAESIVANAYVYKLTVDKRPSREALRLLWLSASLQVVAVTAGRVTLQKVDDSRSRRFGLGERVRVCESDGVWEVRGASKDNVSVTRVGHAVQEKEVPVGRVAPLSARWHEFDTARSGPTACMRVLSGGHGLCATIRSTVDAFTIPA